jgi:hypothetical protein
MTNASTPTPETEQKFTVLLLKPDTVADNFGQDTAMVHVEASDVAQAQFRAREKACDADHPTEEEREDADPWDYHVLAVFEGHLTDIKTDDEE